MSQGGSVEQAGGRLRIILVEQAGLSLSIIKISISDKGTTLDKVKSVSLP
jgi:hypothetical protein